MSATCRAVLVVEDADVLRAVTAYYLDTEADLQVVAAVSSGQAGRARRPACPDLILLDHDMADGSGLEGLPQLRACCPHARIVMFSAWPEVRAAALARVADDFVGKDRPLDEVADRLRATSS